MECDFRGYATKANLRCSDGRTIMPDAFKHQDKVQVPLVWQHGHNDPENVLGHAILEARADGIYAYGFLNETPKAKHTGNLLEHKDINMMSIWANNLVEKAGAVLHGIIREVSLVLSGANPGAIIENVTIRHSDGSTDTLDDEAIIYSGVELEHADGSDEGDNKKVTEESTVIEVIESMTEEQKQVLHYMVGEALTSAKGDTSTSRTDSAIHKTDKDDKSMKHNVFESTGDKKDEKYVLSHSDIEGIVADATKTGSLKEAVTNFAISHGIENIDVLFPEARSLTTTPEFDKRRTEWVSSVLNGARKSPFSRVKSVVADITFDSARAKGYIKGNMKKEEFFAVSRRITTPQTIYKKQKLDRDDIIDITDFDVVAWMKGEMRLMLDEELARAILIGDGREPDDDDKILHEHIRPIAHDNEYYSIRVAVNISDADSSVEEALDAIVLNRQYLKGSGNPTMYTTETFLARVLLLRDDMGRKLYRSVDEVRTELRLEAIVPVEVLDDEPNILAILVNMNDYNVGADRGGQVSMFEDFDIDYNQQKYLIETRCSGALIRPRSAMVIRSVAGADVAAVATAPAFDNETFEVTIPVITGVEYRNPQGDVLAGTVLLDPGEMLRVHAHATAGYYLEGGKNDWSYLRPSGT